MKFILSFFISGLITVSAFAQYLSPDESFYAIENKYINKNVEFRNLLLRGLNDTFEFRYIEFATFTPTILLQIQKEPGGKYKAVVRTSRRAEQAVNRDKGKAIHEYVAYIDSIDVVLLQDVFEEIISKTHYPITPNFGFDGSTHHFISKFGLSSGNVWSPQDGSLKTVVDLLTSYIVRIKKSPKHVALTENERKVLEEVLKASRYSPGIEDYEWLLSFQKSIQKNKNKYFGSLSSEERELVEILFTRMDAEIRRLFAFGNINDKAALYSIVYDMENAFLFDISHERDFSLDRTNPEYQKFINDNLFRSLIKEFKLEDQINKHGK